MAPKRSSVGDGLGTLVEQLVNRVLRPLGLLVISPERIRETLDEAAERGRVTRSDANDLVMELVHRGRQQLDELLGHTPEFPIDDYDSLTALEVQRRLRRLTPQELRAVRDYERHHDKRKSVIAAVDKSLRDA